jgi:hypothetical protein
MVCLMVQCRTEKGVASSFRLCHFILSVQNIFGEWVYEHERGNIRSRLVRFQSIKASDCLFGYADFSTTGRALTWLS